MSIWKYAGDIMGSLALTVLVKPRYAGSCPVCCAPDEGTLKIEGQVSALLSLEAGFNDQLSGRENIFLKGMMLGLSRHRSKSFYLKSWRFAASDASSASH